MPQEPARKRFYQTTAIDYPNSRPHIGTAFEKLGADVQARYRRMEGYDVLFLMGNDENTLKVADRAKELGQEPQAYCDDMARQFREVWDALGVSYDVFIQTSHERHKQCCRQFIQKVYDNGHIYKSSLPIGSFPGEFPAGVDSGIQGTTQNLFEAVQIYSVKGSNKYLMIVEAQGNARYFRAWTATDLEGPWTLLTDNFAIKSNVTFSQNWTNDISHGDLVRSSPDETFPIDPCNLQMVFQGRDPNASSSDYDHIPYKLGLLTYAK